MQQLTILEPVWANPRGAFLTNVLGRLLEQLQPGQPGRLLGACATANFE